MSYADRVNSFASRLSEAGEHINNIRNAVKEAPDTFAKINAGIQSTAGGIGSVAGLKVSADHNAVITALAKRGIKKPIFQGNRISSAGEQNADVPVRATPTDPQPAGSAGRAAGGDGIEISDLSSIAQSPVSRARFGDGLDFDADFSTMNDARASGQQTNLGQHPTDADADAGNIRVGRPNQGTDGSSGDAGAGSGSADAGDAGGSSLPRPPMTEEEQNLFPAGSAPSEGGGQALSGATESLAPEEIAGGLEAAAPETGPLAPLVALIGGLVSLGSSIAGAFHHTDMPTPPPAPKVNVGENLSHIRQGDSGTSAIF